MEGADQMDDENAEYNKTFIDEPAILDKYKAAAEVCDSKYYVSFAYLTFSSECH